jgi:hypothetical protein
LNFVTQRENYEHRSKVQLSVLQWSYRICSGNGRSNGCLPALRIGDQAVYPQCRKSSGSEEPAQTVSVETKRGVSPLGIASLVLGIIACIFCWIPLLGLLVLPLALIGLVLAIVGLILAGVSKKTGFAFPVSGLIVCLLSGFIAVAITGSLAAAFARGKQTNQEQVSNPPGQHATSSKGGDWSKSPIVKQGDITVAIKRVSFIVPTGSDQEMVKLARSPISIQIGLSVANLSTTKKVDFTGWSGVELGIDASSASLADNNQNNYKRITDGMAPDSAIYPQQEEASDTITFETPVENIQWLHLELPAKNFGGIGMLRFEISGDKIRQIRKALADYASFLANSGYLTNADYVKVAQKHKALEQYYANLQKQSQTPAQKLALTKLWNDTILDQWNELDKQLAEAQRNAFALESSKLTAAESVGAAAETNSQVPPQ